MRRGCQEPTFAVIGDYAYSDAKYAIEMFEAYGRRYYDSQKYEMELFYARNSDGSYAANSIGSTKPRQNGKSFGARDYGLDSACMDGKRVLYSAHHSRTSRAMFKEMCDFIESHDDFKKELDYVYKAAGYEGIYFRNGGCIEFQTRTNSGGRGGTYDLVIIDEAQEMTEPQQEALIPVVSAAQELDSGIGTQVIYLGTVPGPECNGTVFKKMHDRAHSGDTDMWWIEWGVQAKKLSDIRLADVELWYMTNPAMGRRMSEAAVRNEYDTMSPDGFARERLGWWPPSVSSAVIDLESWTACATADPPMDGTTVYAVKFSADGSTGTLAACIKPEDGAPHVEVVDSRRLGSGTAWLADWLAPRAVKAAQIVVDGRSNAQPLVDELHRRGVGRAVTVIPKSSEMADACSDLLNAVRERAVTHYDQPALNDSATKSARRAIGSGGGWGFAANDSDPTLIEACALAHWAARKTRRRPGRKARVAF